MQLRPAMIHNGIAYWIRVVSHNSGDYGNCERCGEATETHYAQYFRGWGDKEPIPSKHGCINCLSEGFYKGAPVIDINGSQIL